jgi:hypothetical protein
MVSPVPMRGKGLPPPGPHPHPRVWTPTSASLRIVYVDEVQQFAENQKASVDTLSDGVHLHPRNAVWLPSGILFSLAGSPISHRWLARLLDWRVGQMPVLFVVMVEKHITAKRFAKEQVTRRTGHVTGNDM